MATLTVLKFPTAEGADQMITTLENLQKQELIQIEDAAIVAWPSGKKKPQTRQLRNQTGVAALEGSFWGLLFGLLFFVPLLGMALGAAMGAMAGMLTDVGIDDNFIKQARDQVTPGTSALFLLTTAGVTDRVADELKQRGIQGELIASKLSAEQEAKLKEIFAE